MNDQLKRTLHEAGYTKLYGSYPTMYTIEALIKACGDEFGALLRKNGMWCAVRMTDLENNDEVGYTGATPEAALAQLWLVLKR